MTLNKRVIASVALSVSLVATAVIPAAWAADEHVTCTQNFRAGVDIDAAINLNVAKHLQRNRNWDWRQIAGLNVEQMGQLAKKLPKEDGTPQPGLPLSVNKVKAGDREITGSVYLLPGQEKTIQVTFPNGRVSTKKLQLDENSVGEGKARKGKVVTFKIEVPAGLDLKADDVIAVIPLYYNFGDKDAPVKVIVQPADVVEEEGRGSERPEGSDKPGAGSEGSETPESPDSGDSEGEFPVAVIEEVNDIKEGDNQVTGKVRLYPGQEVEIEAYFPGGRIKTTVVKLEKKATKEGQVPEGGFVPFEIDVPSDVKLMEGDKVSVSPIPHVTDPKTGKSNAVEVIVKAADKVSEPQPEQTPDNGKDKGKEGDNGSTKPAPPSVPGADDNPGTGGGNLSFGSIFGVIAGLGGVVALVMSVVKFFNQNSDVARFLQPLRNFFSLFKF